MEIDDIARIGLLFLDGDALAQTLHNPTWTDSDDIDYDHGIFNATKRVLLRIERIAPERRIFCAVWTRRPDDANGCEVIVLGSKHAWGPCPIVWPPCHKPFWEVMPMFDQLRGVLDAGEPGHFAYTGAESHFFPIRDSNDNITGALELRCPVPDTVGVMHPEIG